MRDRDVRRAVKDSLTAAHANDRNTRIVEEMGVWSGSVRIDIAVINGSLSGFELKSDRDTLDRLPRQVTIYGHVFDFLHLVVGERHAEKAQKILPHWWGVMVARMENGEVKLTSRHEATPNPSPDPYLIAELLNKNEAIDVLDAFGLARGWRSKKMRPIHERLAAELPLDELKEHVRLALKRRGGSRECSSSLPLCVG
jgi:hypothetical protein